MRIDHQELERRMARFFEVCRAAGLKMTHQRTEIYREVAQTGEHPDAETVFARVRQRVPSVSLDTVYRTLWLLGDLELVRTLGPLRERARFDANLEGHHHFVCTTCGLTRDFESEHLDRLPIPTPARSFGVIEAMQVEVRGMCRACAKKKKKKNRRRTSTTKEATR